MNRRRFFMSLGAAVLTQRMPLPKTTVKSVVHYFDTDSIVCSGDAADALLKTFGNKFCLNALYGKLGAPAGRSLFTGSGAFVHEFSAALAPVASGPGSGTPGKG